MSQEKHSTDTVERLRKQRASLADFGLHAFRADDIGALLDEAVQLVSDALDVKLVKVLELLPGKQEVLVRAGVNWKPGVVGEATAGADLSSPAGYALRTGEPVISLDTATETRFRIPDLLVEHGVRSMVNVIIAGEEEPFGVLEVDATHLTPFDKDDVAFLRNCANLLAAAIERLRTGQRLAATAQERDLLLQELRHRVRNILTIIHSLARQTAAGHRSAGEYRDAFLERLHAFMRAEEVVFEGRGAGNTIRGLVERLVRPYVSEQHNAIVTEGESVRLSADQAMMLGLVIHELATNAVKHGALSRPEGSVKVAWDMDSGCGQRVRLSWTERGGPATAPPKQTGFGTRLIEKACAMQLRGKAELDYAPEGLTCTIEFPLA